MNIEFEYLYRDAGNNKIWNSVVFANPRGLAPSYIADQIRNALIDETFFDAAYVRLPNIGFAEPDPSLDHGWHEFSTVELTDEEPDDRLGRTIDELICDFARSP